VKLEQGKGWDRMGWEGKEVLPTVDLFARVRLLGRAFFDLLSTEDCRKRRKPTTMRRNLDLLNTQQDLTQRSSQELTKSHTQYV
jgi:hypothetical protein